MTKSLAPNALKTLLPALFLFAAALPAAAVDKPVTTTDIQITQQAALVVPRDRVVATLRVMARGANARQIQIDINHRMLDALAKVKNTPTVTAETGSYSVNHPFTTQGESAEWRGEQVLTLSSGDFDAVLGLAGVLQNEGLVMGEMRFFVSSDTLKAVQDELTATALKAMQDRGKTIAGDLSLKVDRYKTINVGNATEEQGEAPTSNKAAVAGKSQKAPPPAAIAGEALVTLTVNATVVMGVN
jgi:predicted secreted protein